MKIDTNKLHEVVTVDGLWFSRDFDSKFIVLKTPGDQTILLSDEENAEQELKKEIRIQFNKDTYIILNDEGITLKGKTIKLEGSQKVEVNKSEFTP